MITKRKMHLAIYIFIQFVFIISTILVPNVSSQVPELPEFDNSIYYGYEYGAAGISSALLNVLSSNVLPSNKADIEDSVENALNFIWEHRIEFENNKLPSWGKETENDLIYPSKKYGAGGIIPVFLQYYNYTKNNIWLERAESAYWELSKQTTPNSTLPNWGYAYTNSNYNGIPITDLKFGSAGILEANLNLYEITKDTAYLDHGKQIIKWLESVSTIVDVSNINYKIIPWYFIEGATAPIRLTYGWGNAGIAPLLYRFGTIVNNSTLIDWSIEIGRFLSAAQLENGGWNTELDGKIVGTGFDDGVAGIIYSLYLLQLYSDTEEFNDEITNGIKYIFSKIVNNATIFGFFEDTAESSVSNGYNSGLIGILDVLSKISHMLDQEHLNLISQGIEWLITVGSFVLQNGNQQLLFVTKSLKDRDLVDYSYSDGMGGYVDVFHNLLNNELIASNTRVNLTKVIEGLTLALMHFQNEGGYWTKQRSFENLPRGTFSEYTYTEFDQDTSKTSDSPIQIGIMLTSIILLNYFVIKRKLD